MRMVWRMRRIAPTLGWVAFALALLVNGAAAQDKPKVESLPQIPHADYVSSVAFSWRYSPVSAVMTRR